MARRLLFLICAVSLCTSGSLAWSGSTSRERQQLRRSLERVARDAYSVNFAPQVRAPQLKGRRIGVRHAFAIALPPRGAIAKLLARAREQSAILRSNYEMTHPGKRAPWRGKPPYVVVDRKTSWSRVRALLAAMRAAGHQRVTLLFEAPATPQPSAPGWEIALRRARARGSDGIAALLTRLLRRMACAPAYRAFSAIAGLDPVQKTRSLARDLPAALERCNFPAETDALVAALWQANALARPYTAVTIPIAARRGRRAVTVRQPPRRPWASAHRALLEAQRRCPHCTLLLR